LSGFAISSARAQTKKKTTLKITWATPAGIVYSTALSFAQLNARASVAGSFVYTPAAGAVLNAGTHTLKADFTPADTANYTTIQASTTSLIVAKASLLVKANDQTGTYGTANPEFTASFPAKANIVMLGSSTAAGTGAST
jgi:hypothetical protein